jgi:hypothetical protein
LQIGIIFSKRVVMSVFRTDSKDNNPDCYTDFRQQVRLLGYGYARDQYLQRQRRLKRCRQVLIGMLIAVAAVGLGLLL